MFLMWNEISLFLSNHSLSMCLCVCVYLCVNHLVKRVLIWMRKYRCNLLVWLWFVLFHLHLYVYIMMFISLLQFRMAGIPVRFEQNPQRLMYRCNINLGISAFWLTWSRSVWEHLHRRANSLCVCVCMQLNSVHSQWASELGGELFRLNFASRIECVILFTHRMGASE